MHPAYTWTDSYPHHTNPRAKEIDRASLNLPYYPWPYAHNQYYPIPQPPCHSCCNHTDFGSPYSFTPPYPHYPPPPQPPYHSHGFYPPFPGAHPAYSVPPPHYSTEQPKYDYDKNTPNRCSECQQKSNIGQEGLNFDKKTTDSLVPFSKDYPYPIMWVPSNYMNTESKPKEKQNHSNGPVIKPIEKPLKREESGEIEHNGDNIRLPFPIFLLPSKNNEVKEDTKGGNVDEKTRKNEEVESSKNGVQKVIPVKQLETKEEKKTESKKEEKNVTQKTSKLPPVCLRIDPLPKKKSASRSPSPPGEKERSKQSTIEDSKSFKQQKELPEEVKNDEKKVEKDNGVDTCKEKGVEQGWSSEVEGSKVEKKKTKSLSENEAVVMIQSVYRGFEVRKSQPLMKLRKIAEVRKQVVDLKNRVHDLETTIDDKQKLVIGETIMSLLLKLDTIQGLHPTVRDIRKSVAKELVGLQEKLDSITCVKSETGSEETIPRTDCNDKCVENREIEEATDSHDHNGGEDRSADLQPQVESQNENTGELNNDRIPTPVEPEQLVDDNIDDDKAQFDNNEGTVRLDVEDHEVEPADSIHDMKTAEHLVEQSSEEFNTNQVHMVEETEQPVEDFVQEKSDQTQSEFGIGVDISEHDGGAEARAIDHEPQVESEGQNITIELTGDDEKFQVAMETNQPVDNVIQEKSDQAQPESGIRVETIESVEKQSVVELTGNQLETVKETAPPKDSDQTQALISKNADGTEDVTAAAVEVETDLGTAETRELGKEDLGNGVQNVEEAKMVDDVDGDTKKVVMEDFGAPPLSATESRVSSGGDKKLTEENEKLRAAVEELMKAGSEQVSVIRELTGRVKDLEKELLKKKRRKVKKSIRRPRGSVVEQELRACA